MTREELIAELDPDLAADIERAAATLRKRPGRPFRTDMEATDRAIWERLRRGEKLTRIAESLGLEYHDALASQKRGSRRWGHARAAFRAEVVAEARVTTCGVAGRKYGLPRTTVQRWVREDGEDPLVPPDAAR